MDRYYKHIKKNPNSLLSRFYGIYTVKIKFMKPISVVIMDNLMSQEVNRIQAIYDLKGSLHRRDTKLVKSNRTVRKDLNFLRDTNNVIKMTPEVKEEF